MRGLRAGQLQTACEAALPWEAYLATDEARAQPWRTLHAGLELEDDQRRLLGSFVRTFHLLVVSGLWCGDCVRHGSIVQALADATPCVKVHFIDRDAMPPLRDALTINAGHRVPVMVFLAEDFEPVSVRGDRTLADYRAMMTAKLGAACPMPGAPTPPDRLRAITQDWLDEFEQVHLLLRLSGRLRQAHGD
jgi:hypothetical protein